MRKILLFIFLIGFTFSNAQVEQFGIKAGMNLVNMRSTLGGNQVGFAYNWRPDYHVGFQYRYDMETIVIKVDGLYSRRGTKYGALFQFGNTNITLKYLAVPAVVGYRLTESVDAYVGIELAYLLDASDQYGVINTELYRKLAMGPVIGFGYHAENGVFIETRYGFGMTDIQSATEASGLTSIKDVNTFFEFSVGYYFNKNEL